MSRAVAFVLTAMLTLTPAVVGACAALVCTPGGTQTHHDAAARTQGVHQGHDQTDPHAAHHMAETRPAPVPVPVIHVRGVQTPDCCTLTASADAIVAVVTARSHSDMATAVPTAVIAAPFVHAGNTAAPRWSRFRQRPPRSGPVPAPLVLRI